LREGEAVAITQPTDCAYYLITRAGLAMTALLKSELAAAGIDEVRPAYLGVLISLWQEDGLKVMELGRRAGLEPSTMTGLLDRMERAGLLTRKADPDDRRAQRVRLTGRGRKVEETAIEVVERSLAEMLTGVSESDLESLQRSLRQVLTNTEQRVRQGGKANG
jgi:DNA-binding MarR family transcriptional regulator